jgi:tellurite resistance protein
MFSFKIENFPISFFSVILGLSGFTIACQKIEIISSFSPIFSNFFLWASMLFFILIFITYLIKIFFFKDEVVKEFNHPIKLNFFPTFSISILLFSIAFLNISLPISKYLWLFGTTINFIFTLKIISIWIQHTKFEIIHMNPIWFIPAVGNMLVPIAGINHFSGEISWFFFSIGLIFWIVLFTIFFNRIIFHQPLSEKFIPTLFILIAPPAVGCIALTKLTGQIEYLAKIFYYFAFFIFLLLLFQVKIFYKIKFYLSWWAYSFPIASLVIASTLFYDKTGLSGFAHIAYAIFATLCIIIIILTFKTIFAILRREICIEE